MSAKRGVCEEWKKTLSALIRDVRKGSEGPGKDQTRLSEENISRGSRPFGKADAKRKLGFEAEPYRVQERP